MEDVRFDLPATEDSLADKTLGQLKLTFFKIIPRAGEDYSETVFIPLCSVCWCKHGESVLPVPSTVENGVDKQPKLSDNQTPTDSPKVWAC